MILLPDDKKNHPKIVKENPDENPTKKSSIETKKTSNFCYRYGDPDGDGSD